MWCCRNRGHRLGEVGDKLVFRGLPIRVRLLLSSDLVFIFNGHYCFTCSSWITGATGLHRAENAMWLAVAGFRSTERENALVAG